MIQRDLFSGREEKHDGIDLVAEHNEDFMHLMRAYARTYSQQYGWVSTDVLRVYAQEIQCVPKHPNAWGAIFHGKEWEQIGRQSSEVVSNHAREIRVWRWKGEVRMRLCLTGVTGTLGSAILRYCLSEHPEIKVVGFARDEVKLSALDEWLKGFPGYADARYRLFLGDVRDYDRLAVAFHKCDAVIHCAALKRIDRGADNPDEMIKTNVDGSRNVLMAAFAAGVRKLLLISSDKACQPTTHYGHTKALMETFGVHANVYTYPAPKIGVVRYGNVLGSRGSVLHAFRAKVAAGLPLPITDPASTRFWITQGQAVRLVLQALEELQGGEIIVPCLPSMKITDMATALWPEVKQEIVGLRMQSEKIHECLIAPEEVSRLHELGPVSSQMSDGAYLIKPDNRQWSDEPYRGMRCRENLTHGYRSDTNAWWLKPEEMQAWAEEVP